MTPLCSDKVFLPNFKVALATHQKSQKKSHRTNVTSTISRKSTIKHLRHIVIKCSQTCQEGVGARMCASGTPLSFYCGVKVLRCWRQCAPQNSLWRRVWNILHGVDPAGGRRRWTTAHLSPPEGEGDRESSIGRLICGISSSVGCWQR